MRNGFVIGAALCIAGLCIGCGGGTRQVSISSWQRNVEQYVKQQGRGDPTVLRDVTLSDSRRGYAMLGADRPSEGADANGLLLGFREINGRSYFIYLVGVVDRQQVEEIRIAALATDGGELKWKLSPNDRQALHAYRAYNQNVWMQRFPDRTSPPPQYTGFPRPDDHFQLTVNGRQIIVTHPPSHAQWELTLPQAAQKRA